ncbi:divergent polysaccharide deacetylase family protein [Rhodobacteraceae bacterium B1Z28]|uniref:Divergent polysaccharide deacetylase family protein n=1 Tax=Ruegeria haliotis TaxID=2747601 RepID=A0ABX2PMM7_9RHOB|nr:divergent polysaccharide deacetylase family protein [Ruegeria haliotis]NVO55377.1 divergent polysaccharide deacetylase family protein [Ruegeria haliotis]
MGGFFGGMIAGAVVVLILGAVLSLSTPLANKSVVATQTPKAAPVEVPESSAGIAEAGSDADLVELPPLAPKAAEEEAEGLADLSEIDSAPDTQPTIGGATQELEQPDPTVSTEVSVVIEPPATPPAPSSAPASPQDEEQPVTIDETPAPPAEPESEEVAVILPEFAPESPEVIQDPEVENPFENSPIAVEGDEDVLPRELPRIAALPQIGGEQTSASNSIVGTRVVPLTDRDDAPTEEVSVEVESVSGNPIEAFAATFDNPDSKPLMSIILIDDEGSFGAEALQDFPYPISFAVSPSDPNAVSKMAQHRAAGFEVLALADMPEAASAQDAEVSLAVWLDTLPETVGILEGVETGIQGNRKLADQVAAIAGGTGRGLIMQDNGLNTVQKLAARNGVPSGVVFRDIDGARQDPGIMRRFLDQAAFRAGQEGTVVMLGRVRPETISALLLWGLEDRGSRVAMAPISAVMMKEIQ